MISFSAMFGVVIHDTQIYNMASIATSLPAEISNISVSDVEFKSSEHVHVAAVSFSVTNISQQTSIQPRNENDKKYIFNRRTLGNNFDSDYVWPSI